jgi:hypothetical protein
MPGVSVDKNLHDFAQFMKRREDASQAYVQGDPKPLSQIVARVWPATFFAPIGGYTRGAKEVASKYEQDAEMFEKGSSFTFEILQMEASDDVLYAAILVLTFAYFIARDLKFFTWPIPEHIDDIRAGRSGWFVLLELVPVVSIWPAARST